MKTCRKCNTSKPLESFYQDRSTTDGHRNSCIDCDKARKCTPEVREQSRRYNQSPKGQIAQQRHRDSGKKTATQRIYRSSPDRIERHKEYGRDYHREYYYTPQQQKWLKQHLAKPGIRERNDAAKKAWMHGHGHEKWLAQSRRTCQKRRALKLSLAATFTDREWIDCLVFFGNRCAYCGCSGAMTQDHFVPLTAGGPYTRDNIVPACRPCNTRKHNQSPESWCQPAAYEHVLTYFRSLCCD